MRIGVNRYLVGFCVRAKVCDDSAGKRILASAKPFSDATDNNLARDPRGRWIPVLGGETNAEIRMGWDDFPRDGGCGGAQVPRNDIYKIATFGQ